MEYQIDSDESVTEAIITATQQSTECDSNPDQQLYDVLDPDALDKLFAPVDKDTPRQGGRVSFRYGNCHVIVKNGESLSIISIDEESL